MAEQTRIEDQDRILAPKTISLKEMERINAEGLSDRMCDAYLGRLKDMSKEEKAKYKGQKAKRVIPVPTNTAGGGVLDLDIFARMVKPLVKSGEIFFQSVQISEDDGEHQKYAIKPRFDEAKNRIVVDIDSRYNTEIIPEYGLRVVREVLPNATGELYNLIIEHFNE